MAEENWDPLDKHSEDESMLSAAKKRQILNYASLNLERKIKWSPVRLHFILFIISDLLVLELANQHFHVIQFD